MKKFFFFRSSTDKTVCSENSLNGVNDQRKKRGDETFKTQKHLSKKLDVDADFGLRRSRSFSSGSFLGNPRERHLSCLSDRSSSPSTSSGSAKAQQHKQSSRCRTLTPERFVRTKRHSAVPLDGDYGERKPAAAQSLQAFHDHSRSASLSSSDMSNEVLDLYIDGEQHCQRGSPRLSNNHSRIGGIKKPPRVHCTAPGSPTDSIKDKPITDSYRVSSRDWVEAEFGHDNPQELARHVVEKLCQSRDYSRTHSSNHDTDVPITIQDVYSGSLNRGAALKLNSLCHMEFPLDASPPKRSAELELDSQTQRLLEEKNEMLSTLEKELDRRSRDWSLKVEKYKAEEQRLRERVRELAEQNVSLQREVSSFNEMDTERKNMITFSERQIKDLTSLLESAREENQGLQQNNCELQDKYKMTEEDRACIQRRYGEKEEECKELHSCVARLLRTCSEQEKTIDGLRGELVEFVQKDNSDKHIQRLQMEQIRLTGVELALRREVESHKQEVVSLRHENVRLLERLKAYGKGGGSVMFKLDEELSARLLCLQKQGLSLLNDSIDVSSKLVESIKRIGQIGGKDGIDENTSYLDIQFVIECDMKVQGLRRGTESLTRSLRNISTTLHGKSDLVISESHTQNTDDDRYGLPNGWNSQNLTSSELKAEILLTSLLRDKLYSKDQEIEQLQAELATAARGNDILKCEVQNALDSVSCVSHKMKDLELQMMKKEDKINQLQNDLQESVKELTVIRGILPKVSQERDMMWEEVKQHTEKNMLLNSELNLLKKKIEALDEDILLKEGQITILKDTLGSKSFDLLTSPDQIHEFLLE